MKQFDTRVEWVRLPELLEWPRNPKRHDLASLKRSFKRFGFVQPILVDEGTGRIVGGHGRLDALASLRADGDTPPKGIKTDSDGEWLVPVVRGIEFESEQEAEAYLLADNRTVELGGWDDVGLVEMLKDLEESLEGTGFSQSDLASLEAFTSVADITVGVPDLDWDEDFSAASEPVRENTLIEVICHSRDEALAVARAVGYPEDRLHFHGTRQVIPCTELIHG